MDSLADMGIQFVDTLPAVLRAYQLSQASGERFFKGSHPLSSGYAAYAEAVAGQLQPAVGVQ